MSKPKVNLLYPAQCSNGTTLPPGWYDREEIPEAAFTLGFVYTPPAVPIPGTLAESEEATTQTKQRGKTV